MKKLALILILTLSSVACSKVETACEVVSDDSWKSYYTPTGTVGIRNGLNPCNVEVIGEPLNGFVVVGSDQANSVRLIGDGYDRTMHSSGQSVNGLTVINDTVRFTNNGVVIELGFNGDAKLIASSDAKRCDAFGLTCGDDGVYINGIVKLPAMFPRDAARAHGLIYVADTFGHKVSVYAENGRLVESYEAYYPNSVQVVGRKLIVAAEHQNQILEIDLDTKKRSILFGCDLDVYADPELKVFDLMVREGSGSLVRQDGKGICEGRLYSPNHATLYDDGSLLIADTDNHRVLIVRDGVIKTEIRNLNNPTRAAFWRAGKEIAK